MSGHSGSEAGGCPHLISLLLFMVFFEIPKQSLLYRGPSPVVSRCLLPCRLAFGSVPVVSRCVPSVASLSPCFRLRSRCVPWCPVCGFPVALLSAPFPLCPVVSRVWLPCRLASLGPLGARLLEGNFEANFSYGYEKLEEESARSAEQI